MMSKSHWWLPPSSSLISCGASSRLVSYIREPRGFSVEGRLVARAAPLLPELCESEFKIKLKYFVSLILYSLGRCTEKTKMNDEFTL